MLDGDMKVSVEMVIEMWVVACSGTLLLLINCDIKLINANSDKTGWW